MNIASYLPSSQFSVTVLSIAAAGGLIVGAQYITRPQDTPSTLSAAPETAAADDWEASLADAQAEMPGLPEAPSETAVSTLLEAAKSSNITDTVARSLFINLSNSSAQGLGSDIPTQEKLIATAVQQLPPATPQKTYTTKDLTLVEDSPASQHLYGNNVMDALARHTGATSRAVLLAVGKATDTNNAAELEALTSIAKEYEALVNDLADVPVPKTLAPLQVKILNDIGIVAVSVRDLKNVLNDPVRGLAGLQRYDDMLGEVGRVFTSIAEALSKNGILFNKDEPGAAWAVFTSS